MSNKDIPDSEELKRRLSKQEYDVTQRSGTEPAFTGKYYRHKEDGTYHCIVCNAALFASDTKFDSQTGWPSFWDTVSGAVIVKEDRSHGMVRTEVNCAHCNAHLGHVFPDAYDQPKPDRYCINSAALSFKKS